MQLHIYILSHPLFKQLCSIVQKRKLEYYVQARLNQELGSLLIYETIRKWLLIRDLYVRYVDTFKKIEFIDTQESYIVITSTYQNYNLVYEANNLLPNCHVIFIQWKYIENIQSIVSREFNYQVRSIDKSKKIIIVEKYINGFFIIDLINYLIQNKEMEISQIRLTALTCHINILERLSQKYPGLRLYIVHIIYDYQ